ncbi:PRC-barrel domain-containing protein [Mucilaginibacter sp. ZT4R22]|uniref:PRC-barrel domain-containing protein n=1 Tax=Mucilaginibacter pankratovii TaxID=2772110 RepID=A0ABR7WUN4_9SPHI|nr:PRC-barrel domain-containing protein [Mucilaginibacter pankratovii]MBD1365104.1 PRC-barrel domain-containing protein [Mucilaginibacter pankratovii]
MAFEDENRTYNGGLKALSDSDYQIVDGEPDITGWDVLDLSGNKFGEVDDLLFDPESRAVRYLVVELKANGDDIVDDRNVLIPIGVAELHTDDDDVIVPNVSAQQLYTLPVYEPGVLTPENEVAIRNIFDGGSAVPYEATGFYEHDHFNEDRFYGSGTIATEETDLTIPETPVDEEARQEKVRRIIAKIEAKDDNAGTNTDRSVF